MKSSTLQIWALRGALALLLVAAFLWLGGAGLAAASGALVLWVLVQFTQTLKVLQQSALRPKAQVASAVMLYAQLQANMSLLQVLKITGCLGEALSPEHEQPEIFCWRDAGQVQVICAFQEGKLRTWKLERPNTDAAP